MGAPVLMFSESPEDPFALQRAASAVLDDHGTVVGWSARAEELLGYSAKEVIGRAWQDFLVDPRDLPVPQAAAAESMSAGGWFGVIPMRHRDGRRVEMGFRARSVIRGESCREWLLIGAPAEEVIAWQRDRALLDGLYYRSPIGVVIHSPELRVVRVNRAVENTSGIPAEEHVGCRTGEVLVEEDAEVMERRVRRVLETGKPLIFTEQSCRTRRDPGREREVSVSAFRMEDSSGRILGVAETIEDVTDRHRARRRLALLNEASARIGTTLDVDQTALELAEVAVPSLADYCSVDLLKPVTSGDEPCPAVAAPLLRVAFSPRRRRVAYSEGEYVPLAPQSPQARCLADPQPPPRTDTGHAPRVVRLGRAALRGRAQPWRALADRGAVGRARPGTGGGQPVADLPSRTVRRR